MNKKQLWASFVIFILVCLVVEIIGSFWTRQTVSTWYPTLAKPAWTPPSWLFGPVWFCLYMMIAVAGWLIYRAESSPNRSKALIFYGSQLASNFIWSFLFFSLQSPLLGMIDIILLSLLICCTVITAWPVSRLASFLLIPYFVWVIYATTLNAAIWFLNE